MKKVLLALILGVLMLPTAGYAASNSTPSTNATMATSKPVTAPSTNATMSSTDKAATPSANAPIPATGKAGTPSANATAPVKK